MSKPMREVFSDARDAARASLALLLRQLPTPDQHHNYWLAGHGDAPAVLFSAASKGKDARAGRPHTPRWYVSGPAGCLFDSNGRLVLFDDPRAALKALRESMLGDG